MVGKKDIFLLKSRERGRVACEMTGLFRSTNCPMPRIRMKRLNMFERYFGDEIIFLFTPVIVTSVLVRIQKSLQTLVSLFLRASHAFCDFIFTVARVSCQLNRFCNWGLKQVSEVFG